MDKNREKKKGYLLASVCAFFPALFAARLAWRAADVLLSMITSDAEGQLFQFSAFSVITVFFLNFSISLLLQAFSKK